MYKWPQNQVMEVLRDYELRPSNPNVIAQANRIADEMAGNYAASQVMHEEVEFNDGPSLMDRIRESRLGRAVMMGGAVVAPAGAGFVALAEAPIASAADTSSSSLESECAQSIFFLNRIYYKQILGSRIRCIKVFLLSSTLMRCNRLSVPIIMCAKYLSNRKFKISSIVTDGLRGRWPTGLFNGRW